MKKIICAGIILVVMTSGCHTSWITSSWKADNRVPGKYQRILVVGLTGDADRTLRESMESHLAGDLNELGYTAVSSLREYGPKGFEGMNEKAALDKIKNSTNDAVITIVLLGKEKETAYIPERVYYDPYAPYNHQFLGYRNYSWDRVDERGHYVTDTKYIWESNLYMVATKELVYSVQTHSFDPGSADVLAHAYGKLLVKDMLAQKVLQKQQPVPVRAF